MYRDQQKVLRGKVGVNVEKEAMKRRDAAISLRLKTKEDLVEKRRRGFDEESDPVESADQEENQLLQEYVSASAASTIVYREHQRIPYSKTGVDPAKEALKRREAAMTLRCKTRDDVIREMRKDFCVEDDLDDEDQDELCADNSAVMEYLPHLVSALQQGTGKERLQATVQIRKLLSKDTNPPINEVIKSGCVPTLVQFLGATDRVLQFEAAWALTNIASGTSRQTMSLIQAGGIPYFIKLLSSDSEDLREQTVWALGNIAGDSAKCRDLILHSNVMQPLIEIVRNNPKQQTLRNTAWCISNLLRGKNPLPCFDLVAPILPTLQVLLSYPDEDVVADTCWSLSFLADGPEERIDAVIQLGVIPRIVTLLELSFLIQIPALRAAGNIIAGGTDQQTQSMLDAGILTPLFNIMSGVEVRSVQKECYWVLSNIVACSEAQIQAVIDARLLPLIIHAAWKMEVEVKREAIWAIANIAAGGSCEQIHQMVLDGCFDPLVETLGCGESRLIEVALGSLSNILASGERIASLHRTTNDYRVLLYENGAVATIEELQHHPSQEIYERSQSIIADFYSDLLVNSPEPLCSEPEKFAIQPCLLPVFSVM